MSEPALDPRDEAVLAELLELGLAAVRHVQGRLLEAEDGKAVAELSLALGRVTRSVRQTLALKARLKRERLRQAKEAFEAEAAAKGRLERRKAQVETAVTRLIWSEYEHAESLELLEGLEHHLAAETADEGFPATPVPAVIARICDALGIDPPSPSPQGEGDRHAVEGDPPDCLCENPLSPPGQLPLRGSSVASPLLPLPRVQPAPAEPRGVTPARSSAIGRAP